MKIDNAKLYYEIEGTGDDLLLLHGVRGSHKNWKYLLPHLSKHFRVIMPDLRGHGQSSPSTEVAGMDLWAKDVIKFLNTIGIKQCFIVGHSFGGFIAQIMAIESPEYFRALILFGTAPVVDAESAEAQIKLGQLAYGLSPEEAVEKLLDFAFHDPEKIRNTPGMIDLLIEMRIEGEKLALSHGYAQGATLRYDIQDRISEIKTPTLIIFGAQDSTFPSRWADFYKQNLPNGTIRILEDTNHEMNFEQPEALAKLIVEFVKNL